MTISELQKWAVAELYGPEGEGVLELIADWKAMREALQAHCAIHLSRDKAQDTLRELRLKP